MQLHARALFDTAGGCELMESGKGFGGATVAPEAECSARKSLAKFDQAALIAFGSAAEKPVASGWVSGSLR
jgi:hypothetical protein